MKKFLLTLTCVSLMAGAAFSQTASFSFNDNIGTANSGTYTMTQTFTVDLYATFDFTALGYSVWLEAPTANGFASSLSITNYAYMTFIDPTDNGFPKAFTDSSGARPGYLTDTDTVINPQTGTQDQGDLGATSPATAAGTYKVGTITFSLSNAPAGTYVLYTTTLSPKGSEVNEGAPDFTSHFAPAADYTITITSAVPEPATWSLLGLGGLGSVGMMMLRRRRA